MKNIRKALSFILVFVMVLSLVPATVLASAVPSHNTLSVKAVSYKPVNNELTMGIGSYLDYDEDDNEYQHYDYNRRNGDILTITYSDNTVDEYVYDWSEDGYVSVDGGYIDEWDVYFGSDQYENHWTKPGTYYMYVEYEGVTGKFAISLLENPVKGFTFTPANPLSFVMGLNCGHGCIEEDGEIVEEYDYYYISYRKGDKLTVSFKDGRKVDYFFDEMEDVFESEDGDIINESDIYDMTDQVEKHWTKPGTYYFTLTYAGATTTVPAKLVANPVKSISYAPVNTVYYEGLDSDLWYDDNDELYNNYDILRDIGDKLTVNYTDGTSKVFTFDKDNSNYVSSSGDIIYSSDVDFEDDQNENHWNVGTNYFTVKYYGRSASVKVEIKPNPVKSVSYTPVKPFTNFDGNRNEEGVYAFPGYSDGDIFTVNFNDGTSKKYVFNALEYDFVNVNDSEDRIYPRVNESDSEHWQAGTHYFKLIYAGKTAQVPVTIQENPIKTISAKCDYPLYLGADIQPGGYVSPDGMWDDECCDLYYDMVTVNVTFKDGTTFTGSLYELTTKKFGFNLECTYSVKVSGAGKNTGTITVAGMDGTLSVEVKNKLPDTDKKPSCGYLTNVIYLEKGKTVNMPLLKIDDKGYTRNVKVIAVPAGLSVDKNGVLTGTAKEDGEISLFISWENSAERSVYSVRVQVYEKSSVISLPSSAPALEYDEWTNVKASASDAKWYKLRAYSTDMEYIIWTGHSDIKVYNSAGVQIDVHRAGLGDLLEGTPVVYYGAVFTSGEYYYIRCESDGMLSAEGTSWRPMSHGQGSDSEPTATLTGTNVNKTFDGVANKTWNVYTVTETFNFDIPASYVWAGVGVTLSVISPVEVCFELASATSPNFDLVYTKSYSYDPNNEEECEDVGIFESQETRKDELNPGEKEYRFDHFSTVVVNKFGTIEYTNSKKIYVPVGYALDENFRVVKKSGETSPVISTANVHEVSGNQAFADTGAKVDEILSAVPGATVKDINGNAVKAGDKIKNGMTVTKPDGTKLTVIVLGDVDCDGGVSVSDARLSLRQAIGLEHYNETGAQYRAANVEAADKVSVGDARLILRVAINLDSAKNWKY